MYSSFLTSKYKWEWKTGRVAKATAAGSEHLRFTERQKEVIMWAQFKSVDSGDT